MNERGTRCLFVRGAAIAIACGLLSGWGVARADNLKIENVTVAPRDARIATLKFDISWADSWRHEVNHDAAWLFFKARADDKSEWQHVRLVAIGFINFLYNRARYEQIVRLQLLPLHPSETEEQPNPKQPIKKPTTEDQPPQEMP